MTLGSKERQPIGYVPQGHDLDLPGDRRRFPRYATLRERSFDLVSNWEDHEVLVLSHGADVTRWVQAPPDRRIVVDLADAYLDERHGLRQSVRGLAKWSAGESSRPVLSYRRALERLLKRANAVVCSTEEQAAKIAPYNGNVHSILDLHGEFDFLSPKSRSSRRLDIVWEGMQPTLPAIRPVLPALQSLARRTELRLHLVTDLYAPRFMNRFVVRRTDEMVRNWGVDIELHCWSVQKLTEVAQQCDVAIVPVDLTDPFTRGKPENRMRIFWRLGLPVVVSASPAHRRAVELAGMDKVVLCSSADDWERALLELSTQTDLRLEIARTGQLAAATKYDDELLLEKWDEVFKSLRLGAK